MVEVLTITQIAITNDKLKGMEILSPIHKSKA